MSTETGVSLDDLFTPEALAEKYPGLFKVATLRHQVRNRQTNGLNKAVFIIGQRLLVSKSRYEVWIAERVGEPA